MAIYNPHPSPVVIDDEGHVLGGRERREDLDAGDARIAQLLELGLLVEVGGAGQDAAAGPQATSSPNIGPSRTAKILPAPAAASETTTQTSKEG